MDTPLRPAPRARDAAAGSRRAPRVLVVGAGFGGLTVLRALLQAGHTDVTVLERADEVGGVWRDNTYPGAACDVPSSLYSWSWAPHPSWPRRYSQQPDILDYVRGVAAAEGLLPHVRTGTAVRRAVFDEGSRTWQVTVETGGRTEVLEADVLVPAVGQLSQPVVPALPGLDDFAGPAFHSARWRHDVDLTGKRVAVVGTGASAIQFVPGIVDRVGAMTVFQRSAPYVVPKPDRAYTRLHGAAFRALPPTQAFGRGLTRAISEWLNRSFTHRSVLTPALRAAWEVTLLVQVRDRRLRRRLRPDYPIGCKRVLFSNDWYPALAREHVEVVTEPVAEVLPHGVRTADGREHAADVLVWGTGFAATRFLETLEVTGVGGADLHEVWGGKAHAHLGLAVPGFPQMFVVYGPHTNLGGSSIIQMLEAQAGYVVQVVDALAAGRVECLDVRPEVAEAFEAEMGSRLADSVWTQCSNWYNDGGTVSTNWPGLAREYEHRLARVSFTEYHDLPAQPAVPARTRETAS
ncbi:flavin-containing monooxygenase [Nocardioides perillae]|uniref:Cation diffusion facilitator CzcD-associated flavoprotein CzcO n=1 Tax=Nocardioides perillae TaxID=1119534 RepID=A0A7Y9RUC7_9ACTN|nr:NAD(P)/FAD-dependent oxidoreductase [Nocardioides perillae]NYG55504.1 cation diffusion facilitator CzcD-associated flavoprotein CzcO [Nocardioides perillae]